MNKLNEDKRSELLNKSKNADDYKDKSLGRNRYQRRVRSKVANSVKEFNAIDMNEFFKRDILNFDVKVTGETDSYLVSLSFSGVLKEIQRELNRNNEQLNFKIIVRSLITCFNNDNVYVSCSCADWVYRQAYWATRTDTNSGVPELRPSDITNPNDTKGKGCKHVLLVLSNNTFLNKVASVIFNYINYMKEHYQKMYADIIYPAVYGKPYEDDVQLSFGDKDALDISAVMADKANQAAIERGRFKKGNQSGIQFAPSNRSSNNKQFDFDSVLNSEK